MDRTGELYDCDQCLEDIGYGGINCVSSPGWRCAENIADCEMARAEMII